MSETEIREQVKERSDREMAGCVSSPRDRLGATGSGGQVSVWRGWVRVFRWPAALAGQAAQWICPTGVEERKACCSDSCQYWVLCKCAQEEFRSTGKRETRTWLLLAACGGAVILYWLFAL